MNKNVKVGAVGAAVDAAFADPPSAPPRLPRGTRDISRGGSWGWRGCGRASPTLIHGPPLPRQLALWFNLLETGSASVRSGDALSAYVYLVTKSNAAVGYVQGFNGIAQVTGEGGARGAP